MDNDKKMGTCYQGHLGNLLIETEQEVLKALFTRVFGLHLVWIGYRELLPVLELSLVQHKLILGRQLIPLSLRASQFIAHPETLSIQPDSVDVVILAHALELSAEPHHVLREAYRILRPEGQLIVTGFNPMSMLGIWHTLHFKQKLFTAGRIIAWCRLLDLELSKIEPFFYRPPLQHVSIMRKMKRWEDAMPKCLSGLAGGYCLNFVKRVVKLTPIRPNWRKQEKEVWVGETVQNASSHQKRTKKKI